MIPVDLKSISDLDKKKVLEIVNGLQINPVLKAIVLAQLNRANQQQLKSLLLKVQSMIETIQTGNMNAIDSLKAEMQKHCETASIPEKYIDGLFDLLKPEMMKPNADHSKQ